MRKPIPVLALALSLITLPLLAQVGSLDTTFDSDGFNTTNFDVVNTFAEATGAGFQSDGRIVVGGNYYDGFDTHFALLRVNTDGTQDFGFGNGGVVKVPSVPGSSFEFMYDLVIQTDDKIVAAGFDQADGGNFIVMRFTSEGVLDTTFDGDGIKSFTVAGAGVFDRGRAVTLDGNGKILVAGYCGASGDATNRDWCVARLNTNGSFDTTFDGDGKLRMTLTNNTETANAILVQPDGKILVGGGARYTSSNDDFTIVRLNANGSFDTTFGGGDGIFFQNLGSTGFGQPDEVTALALQSDGKIVAVGAGQTTQDGSANGKFNILVGRLNTDGTFDTSFSGDGWLWTAIQSTSTFNTDWAEGVAITSAGKILVSSWHQLSAGPLRMAVHRFNSNGNLDNSYGTNGYRVIDFGGGGNGDENFGMIMDSTGRALPFGRHADASFNYYVSIGRLTANGDLDTAFAGDGTFQKQLQGNSVEHPYAVGRQSTGKTVVGGLSQAGGSFRFAAVRYNTNGTQDTTFGSSGKAFGSTGGSDSAYALAIDGSDRVVMAGTSTPAAGAPTLTVMRFTAAGVLDTSFSGDGIATAQTGTNSNEARAVAIQSDGKIVVAGATSNTSTDWNLYLARFTTAGALDTTFDSDGIVTLSITSRSDQLLALEILSDGKLLVGGYSYDSTATHQDFLLARFNSNGSLDTTFGPSNTGWVKTVVTSGSFRRSEIRDLDIDWEGRILAAGKITEGNFNNLAVVRYSSDGVVDASFGSSGIFKTNFDPTPGSGSDWYAESFGIDLQQDDKIVAFGSLQELFVSQDDFLVARLNWDDGSLDTTFSSDGFTSTALSSSQDQALGGYVEPTGGKIMAGGRAVGSDFGAARYIGDSTPVSPGAADLAAASDSGRSNADNITNDNTPTFNGTCTVGLTVVGQFNTAHTSPFTRHLCRSTTYALTSGAVLADGNYSVRVYGVNGFGATGNVTSGFTLVVDTVAAAPTISAPTANQEIATANAAPVTFSGAGAETGADVFVKEGAATLCSVRTTSASWSCTATLTAGTHNISVTQTDIAGNTSSGTLRTFYVLDPPSIAKAFSPTQIATNTGVSTLTFTVTNPSVNTRSLAGIAFTDNLPSGVVVAASPSVSSTCSGTVTATAGSGTISLSGGSVGTNTSCAVSVNVRGTSAGTKNNVTGNVSSSNGGTGNTASATLTIVDPPVIAKSFSPTQVAMGTDSTITFTITNPAANVVGLTGVGFTDTLPSGVLVSSSPAATNNCGGTLTGTAGSGSISLSGASIAVSSNCAITIAVTGTQAGSKLNSVQVTSTNGGTGNTASDTLTVVAPPTLTKAFGAAVIPLQGSTTLTFTIMNPAANTVSLTGVGFTDNFPAGLEVASPNGLTGSCGGGTISATAGSSLVTLSGATLATSGSCTFSVDVIGTVSGQKDNTTGAPSSNEGGSGSPASASVTVVGPPEVAKSFGPTQVTLGGVSTMTITLTNPVGNGVALTGVTISDTFPSGMEVASVPNTTNTCGGTLTATAASTSVSLSGGSLPANSSCSFTVDVVTSASGVLTNTTGNVGSTNGGAGATASADLLVVAPPVISKSFAVSQIRVNDRTSLKFELSNPNATVALTGVAFTDNLPAGLIVASPNGLSGGCNAGTITAAPGSTSVSLSGGSIAAASGCIFSVTVQATGTGLKQNVTGNVSSANGGTGNTASADLNVPAILLPDAVRGDVDGDQHSDIVWRNGVNGTNAVWLLDGASVLTGIELPSLVDPNLEIRGLGDLDGDGLSDIFWRNRTTGTNAVWLMNGTSLRLGVYLPAVVNPDFVMVAVGDLNGDGVADVVWRNQTNGDVAVWVMNGDSIMSSAVVARVTDLNMKIRGVGDVDGDGKDDILWRHETNGTNAVWFMDGASLLNGAMLTSAGDANLAMAAVGDFNADGRADIFWVDQAAGTTGVWLLDGLTVIGVGALATISEAGWEVQAVGDVDADGRADIIWRRTTTGENGVWFMNGTTVGPNDLLPAVTDLDMTIVAPR